ncbi:hypothetical protein GCM10022240_09650 [Microbacterium kribbense]|uniref:Thioredoxin n=1 Tax=Microbacterium kribbense TaxID=433645 RepID=A0ABP7G992_9MICO
MPVLSALLLLAALVAVGAIIGAVLRATAGRARTVAPNALDLAGLDVGELGEHATLLQFSTELCARCPQVRRSLSALAGGRDGVRHAEVDLTHLPEVAARLHILQTPTVFVLDGAGTVRTRFGGVPARGAIDRTLDLLIGEPAHV